MSVSFKLEGKISTKRIIIFCLSVIAIIGIVHYSIRLFNISDFDKKELKTADAKVTNYELTNDYIISTSADSQLDYKLKAFVSTFQITVAEPAEQDTELSVYFKNGIDYSEDKKILVNLKKGDIATARVGLNTFTNGFKIVAKDQIGLKLFSPKLIINGDNSILSIKQNYIINNSLKLFLLFLFGILIILFALKSDQIIHLLKLIILKLKSMKNLLNYINFKKSFFVLTILISIIYNFQITNYILNSYNQSSYIYNVSSIPLHEITKNDKVIQSFKSKSNELSGFGIEFKTFARSNSSTVNVTLKSNDCTIQTWTVKANELKDNYYYSFILSKPLENVNNKDFSIEITSDAESGNAITIGINELDNYKDGFLSVNNTIKGDMDFKTYSPMPFNMKLMLILLLVLLNLVILFFTYKHLFVSRLSLEKIALILVLGFGFAYMLTITALSPPDEWYHYKASYKLSNLLMLDTSNDGNAQDFNFIDFDGHQNVSSGYARIVNDIGKPRVTEEKEDISRYLINNDYPIVYLPQSMGILLGRLLQLNLIWIFYLGRLFNLICFSILIYFAVKIIPYFKTAVILIAMLPMTLQQAASYSYDAFINGTAILLVACIVASCLETKKIEKFEYLRILILGILLAPAKIVYATLLLLAFLIPSSRFKSKRDYLIKIFALLFFAAIAIMVNKLPSLMTSFTQQANIRTDGETLYSFSYIINNPINTIQIFVNSLNQYGNFYINSCIGQYLSGLSLPIDINYVNMFIALLVLASIKRTEYIKRLNYKNKILILISIIIIIFLTMLSMFLGWTPINSQAIEGVQGRYFIPIVLPILLLINNKYINLDKIPNDLIIFISICLQFLVLENIIGFTLNFI